MNAVFLHLDTRLSDHSSSVGGGLDAHLSAITINLLDMQMRMEHASGV